MKKFNCLAVALVLLMASATSCTDKDGVYTPKKKISKIYSSSTLAPEKTLEQVWNWDGKLLKTIDHYGYNSNEPSWIETYTYDGKRLTRIEDIENEEYTVFEYDGDHLKTAKYYYENSLVYNTAYSYDGKKMSKIVCTRPGFFKGEAKMMASVLPLSDEVFKAVDKKVAKFVADAQTKDLDTLVFDFTWDGDNISQIVMNYDEDTTTVKMEYDKKANPKHGFLNLYSAELVHDEYSDASTFASENNITKLTVNMGGHDEVVNYTYQYDGKYPTVQTSQYSNILNTQSSIYYEYE